jgi:hypothetical protein
MPVLTEIDNPEKLNTALAAYDDSIWFIPALVPDTRIGWKNFARLQNKTLCIRNDSITYRWHPNGHIEQYDKYTDMTYHWGPKPTLESAIKQGPSSAFYQFHADGSVEVQWPSLDYKLFWGAPRKTIWVEGEPEYESFEPSGGG